ncbi:MAG TPA: O-antigen ligase family protein [Paracoccaceae bacterium]|nr:O-antigen ligase family protein [Paracoccaceae bacterium]
MSAETGKLRTAELMPHPVRGPGADFRVAVAAADYAFAAFIILISADAFMFLGVHSFLWLAAYGYIALRILLSFRRFLDFLLRNLVYLGFPALALVSTIWSDLPAETVRLSLQLIVTTLIALFIGMRLAPREILWITGAVLLVLMAASMANIGGAIGPAYNDDGNFMGIFLSKNAFGHRSVVFTVTAVFMIFLLRGQRLVVRIAFLAGLAITAQMVSISGSATAVVLTLAMGGLSIAVSLALLPRIGPVIMALPLTLVLATSMILLIALRFDPVGPLFDALGKDATMTGRTILWEFGIEKWLDRPWLGYGAAGFWTHPAHLNDIAIYQARYGETVHGFHSLPVELLVMFGPLGLVVHGAIALATLGRALRASGAEGAAAVWLLVTTLAIYGMAMVGPQLHTPHSVALILVVAGGASLTPAPRRRGNRPALEALTRPSAV